ncbi:vWA domain-containing protein [Rhodococcus sp. NPDC049939]|uniref:vWA domain-containing protein n=1 Tax=Rhodococcus sp. NPDC049939 TaxID=3155511 RepID=UPI0033F8B281
MTNPDLTLIAVLLDRSGSMQSIKSDTEGGFDAFIAEQRTQPGEAVVTLAQFDNRYERIYSSVPVADVPALELVPRGSTALLDGIGRLTTEIGEELAALPEEERPGRVQIVVITDGHENSSHEWSLEAVHEVIRRQEEVYSWDYYFLGANMDAISVGQSMGFVTEKSIRYSASPDEVGAVFSAQSKLINRKRGVAPGAPVPGFSAKDRADARGTGSE